MLFKINSNSSTSNFEAIDEERKILDYSDCSKRFYEVSRDFSKQYAHIYAARLNTFRNILDKTIHKKWQSKYKILKLCELREKGIPCIVIGTLFKHQELKPSVLKELSDQLEIIPQPSRTHFVHEADTLVLEDELQRIKLVGDCIDVHSVVTGVVCAVLGSEDDDGIFTVRDVCWAGCNIQKSIQKLEDDRYVVLVSGLNLASKSGEHWLPLHLLLEWIAGASGTTSYQQELSKIVRVIVAGGVFTNYNSESTLNEADVIASAEAVDNFCTAVSAVAPLDLMPGCKDPSSVMLPQKPFHYCLFSKAVEYKSFNRVSNPYECDIGGFLCLGSSGEPVRDVMRYSNIDSSLGALIKTLEWRHIAPTAPDTLPCTPCFDTDPFTMYNCPSLYFSGNCDKFDTTLYQGEDGQCVRVVCVPDFCITKTAAIVNLSTMECYSMSFD